MWLKQSGIDTLLTVENKKIKFRNNSQINAIYNGLKELFLK